MSELNTTRFRGLRLLGAHLILAMSIIPQSAHADATSDALQLIAQYTGATMQQLNLAPFVLWYELQVNLSWLNPDQTSTTSNLQQDLSTYSGAQALERAFQVIQQPNINQNIFGSSPVSNANDLSYQTLLGYPVNSPDPRQQTGQPPINFYYNYMINASGMGLTHVAPGTNWTGSSTDQANYVNYYNAITAVESYNAFLLSDVYAQTANNFLEVAARNQLITDASSSSWFSQVATENLGVVLRQLLMFQSQSFMVLTELLDVEKQMLAAQAMNNTMLALTGTTNEQFLLRKAMAKMPGSS